MGGCAGAVALLVRHRTDGSDLTRIRRIGAASYRAAVAPSSSVAVSVAALVSVPVTDATVRDASLVRHR